MFEGSQQKLKHLGNTHTGFVFLWPTCVFLLEKCSQLGNRCWSMCNESPQTLLTPRKDLVAIKEPLGSKRLSATPIYPKPNVPLAKPGGTSPLPPPPPKKNRNRGAHHPPHPPPTSQSPCTSPPKKKKENEEPTPPTTSTTHHPRFFHPDFLAKFLGLPRKAQPGRRCDRSWTTAPRSSSTSSSRVPQGQSDGFTASGAERSWDPVRFEGISSTTQRVPLSWDHRLEEPGVWFQTGLEKAIFDLDLAIMASWWSTFCLSGVTSPV